MGRLILLFLLVIGVWMMLKRSSGRAGLPRTPAPAPERMVTCHVCGLRLPHSEALHLAEHDFCCAEHRQQHAKRGDEPPA